MRIGMMRLDQTDVVEEKLVAPRRAELAALEEDANLRRGAVLVVGLHLHDHRHLVRRVAFEDDLFQLQFLAADARTFFDRALDHVARDALLARLFDDRGETRIPRRISAAELRGDHDLFDEFARRLPFFQTGDFAFCVQPLTTHALFLTMHPPARQAGGTCFRTSMDEQKLVPPRGCFLRAEAE